jgi:DNA-binding response OmpR family regulator
VVRRILERAGYEVAVVPDGEQVAQTLSSEPFDVLLLDVVMPGPSCAETIRRARALQPTLCILLASGYTADTNVGALLEEQGIPTISKPYDPDQLLRMLRRQLAPR